MSRSESVQNEEIMARILQNQRTIIEQNTKILQQQDKARREEREKERVARDKIPLTVKRTVRAAAKNMQQDWDFTSNFRSSANNDVNKTLVNNIKTLTGMEKVSERLIERALKAHFLTQRRKQKQIDDGSRSSVLKQERRRHRLNEKLRRRIDTLNKSSTWSEAEKSEIRRGLTIEYMSPEESEEEEVERQSQRDSSDSEHEGHAQVVTRKVIKVRPIEWRSERFNSLLGSLDRKFLRRSSEKAKSMMKERRVGPSIPREVPEDVPGWMRKPEAEVTN